MLEPLFVHEGNGAYSVFDMTWRTYLMVLAKY